ncbi:MAG: hypothetical protein M3R47_16775, partial [Chloroflexota bacterium]|nr:hypothetical protein [Chloroflexota bacterium]
MEHSRLSPPMEQIENQLGQNENPDGARQNASRSDQPVLHLILKLCTALKEEGINYCHWKSNNALDRSANGENDIDLLISRSDAGRFSELLYRFGFKQAKAPPDKQMPGVL